MKKHLSTIILVLVLVLGLGIMLYPTVSDWWNSFHQTRAIASYSDTVATMDNEIYDQLWQEAEAYNAALAQKANPYFFTEEDQALYDSTLNVSGTGIMGYIDIPEIKCTLPIYHGTSEAVLQVGVGHIEGSSLPVGGEGTHCVLSGHSGLPSAVLFTHLEDLDIGDLFTLQIMDETLTYEVDRFNRVLPHEMELLTIEEGKDSCTLVTCTPYGINTHRLLVPAAAAVPMLLLLFLWLMFGGSKTPKKPKKAK